ncbi:NADH-FMN oxidoreductase RutF, flavin reductase (DIM6/NTAB) family [Alkalibacterium subtropicum]|uniref:NADH-FMN oxidoreductase RutF, flavin reductase (DIM6/NTAB) family n=1 Tax=Alkalibacterium subtropicum TaxID=753702 RepID=A0A1I1HQN8_9LACT|nr:flavin reductase family protein [Alkalibacterium subtropicum]SFC26176.1 NADH-FMN oxidoreductase RutF, flavin reductase (DIM6/NTAB) family [Alkalibacterium subtropicum]
MHHFKTDDLSPKQQYKFLTGSIIPRPIAWITSLNQAAGIVNLAPFSFFSVASNQIPLLSVSILRTNQKSKDTADNILNQKEAVIHIVSRPLTENMNETSAPLPPDESELDRTDLHLVKSTTVDVPAVKEALVRFETVLYQHIPIKNETDEIITDHFLLKVTDFHFDEKVLDTDRDYILADKLEPMARLSGLDYAALGEIISMVRPTS